MLHLQGTPVQNIVVNSNENDNVERNHFQQHRIQTIASRCSTACLVQHPLHKRFLVQQSSTFCSLLPVPSTGFNFSHNAQAEVWNTPMNVVHKENKMRGSTLVVESLKFFKFCAFGTRKPQAMRLPAWLGNILMQLTSFLGLSVAWVGDFVSVFW